MTKNKTAEFLIAEYAWDNASLELRDVQPLFGGVIVRLPSWTMSEAFVSRIAPDGTETKYRLPLKWNENEKQKIIRLCVKHDLLTIQPEERPGIPDETRPTLILSNSRRESHTVSKWADVADAHFDAIYHIMLGLAERTAGLRPIPERFNNWQKAGAITGLVLGLLLLSLLAYVLARQLVNTWWPERLGALLVLLPILMGFLLVGMAGLVRLERHKSKWERTFTHIWVVMAVNFCFVLAGIAVWGLAATAVSVWRSDLPLAAGDERFWYGMLGYAAVFTAVLLLLAAGWLMPMLINLMDDRF